MDRQVGRILDHLRERELADRTILIITSDHGEEFLEHGHKHHSLTVFNEVLHVPLLISIPGMRGRDIDEPTSLVYTFPWLMLRGADSLRQRAVDTIRSDLAPMMMATDGAVIAELIGRTRMFTALIHRRYKIIHDLRLKTTDTYDLEQDPGERHRVIDLPVAQERIHSEHLRGYLRLRSCKKRYRLAHGRP